MFVRRPPGLRIPLITMRVAFPLLAGISLTVAAVSFTVIGNASQVVPAPIPVDRDDIGGRVRSDEGAEAGVWVVAETDQLPTRFVRIVVTDEQGRYVLPDLPPATYDIFVRGYGLIDSARVRARPGQRIDLTTVVASSEREAAAVYPASYWLTVMRVPQTGPIHPADLTRTLKGCMSCHQLGTKATRELTGTLETSAAHLAAWDERMKVGPDPQAMYQPFAALRGQRTMFSEWTERIAAGAYPLLAPPRPRGIERNIVLTMWDWGGPTTVAPDAAASTLLDPAANANGPIYAASRFQDALLWLAPGRHERGDVPIASDAPLSNGGHSPHFGDERLWRAAAQPSGATIDQGGRVWVAARHRAVDDQPVFCTDTTNRFVRHFPLPGASRQVSMFDPKTKRVRQFDTCFTATESALASNGRLYFGGAGAIGWLDTRAVGADQAPDPAVAQGWCPLVVDTNGDGKITKPWTEPDQAADPTRDRRIDFTCGHVATAPDGSVWCGPDGVMDDRIVRLEIGAAAPDSCKAEIYQVPAWRDVSGGRGMAVDSAGVAWVNMAATDQLASFDRRLCQRLNGPEAVGPHCPDGWQFHAIPGPPFSIAAPTAAGDTVLKGGLAARTTDFMHSLSVDRADVLGVNGGRDVPMAMLSNGDAVLAYVTASGEFLTFRVPYPLGFYGRAVQPRIDDPRSGWKGRGLWASYGSEAGWHVEGGAGVRSKVVKFQLRPDPLAK